MLKVNITPNNYFRTPRINLSTAIKYIKPQLLFMIPLSNFVLLRYPPNSFFKVVKLLFGNQTGHKHYLFSSTIFNAFRTFTQLF